MSMTRSLAPAACLLAGLASLAIASPDEEQAAGVLASEAGPQEKALACLRLAAVGGAGSVPALADLLGDEQLADYARSGLEAIADPAAAKALREAAGRLTGRPLVGVVNSLGVRRDAEAVPVLRGLVRDPARGAAPEALAALGSIASPESVETIRAALTDAPPNLRLPAADAALAASATLHRDGKPDQAEPLLAALRQADLPAWVRAAAANTTVAGRRLFDGRSLDGWEGDPVCFRVEGGAIVGGSLEKEIPRNEFVCTTREYGDFELRLKARLVGGKGNGGIQLRSRRVPGTREVAGYQADLAAGYWGGLYDESRRRKFLVPPPDPATLAALVRPDGWNDFTIRCEGPRIRVWLNGRLTVDFTEDDPQIPRSGLIGLQVHGGPPSEAQYRDVVLAEIRPAP